MPSFILPTHSPGLGRRLRRAIKHNELALIRYADNPRAVRERTQKIAELKHELAKWEAKPHAPWIDPRSAHP